MSEARDQDIQRIYLTCGSVILAMFCLAAVIVIMTFATGKQVEVLAAMSLAACIALLLFNTTLLCGSCGGPKILATAKTLLWLSFLFILAAVALCIVSMTGNL